MTVGGLLVSAARLGYCTLPEEIVIAVAGTPNLGSQHAGPITIRAYLTSSGTALNTAATGHHSQTFDDYLRVEYWWRWRWSDVGDPTLAINEQIEFRVVHTPSSGPVETAVLGPYAFGGAGGGGDLTGISADLAEVLAAVRKSWDSFA